MAGLDDGLMAVAAARRGGVPDLRRAASPWVLLAPALALLLVFFAYPVADILWRSVSEPEIGTGVYERVLLDGTTARVLVRTMVVALVITAVTLVLAYPLAYLMTLVGPAARTLLVALVLLPFWTSLMARTFAWIVILQEGGPLQRALALVGLRDVVLLGTTAGVAVGMTQILLPYMVLSLYASMADVDRSLLLAAQGLGATRRRAFLQVFLPLSLPGVVAGSTLVFVLSLGFYVTPRLLGSPRDAMLAQLVGLRVDRLLDFPGAGALAALLLVVTALVLLAARPLTARTEPVHGADRG